MKRVVPIALLAVLCGCGDSSEFSKRFEAERARWHADLEEHELRAAFPDPDEAIRARIGALHATVARRFGADSPPTASELADPDARLRLQIAGSSALYELDLAAQGDATAELADRYARLGEICEFDRALWFRSNMGEASIRERLDDPEGALSVYRRIVGSAGRASAHATSFAPGSDAEYLLDLHVHAGILAVENLPASVASRELESLQASIAGALSDQTDSVAVGRLEECLAQIYFLEDRWEEGCELLDGVIEKAGLPARRARLVLARAEVFQFELGDLEKADAGYREVIAVMTGSPIATDARLRLAKLLLDRRRATAALDLLDETLELGASLLDHREAEALYWKAHALIAVGRWEDAIPTLRDASQVEPESQYSFLSAIERQQRLERLYRPTSTEAPSLVALAERVPRHTYRRLVPKRWSDYARERRARALWRKAIEGFLGITGDIRDVAVRERAIVAAAALAEDRANDSAWAESLGKPVRR